MLPKRRGNMAYPLRSLGMKMTKLFALIGTALVGLTQPTWGAPHGGGGFGGDRAGSGGGRGHFGGFAGAGARAAPLAFGGARFSGRSFGTINRTSRIYSGGGERPAVGSRGFTALGNPSAPSRTTGTATIGRQQNRAESLARQNSRVSNS